MEDLIGQNSNLDFARSCVARTPREALHKLCYSHFPEFTGVGGVYGDGARDIVEILRGSVAQAKEIVLFFKARLGHMKARR